MIKKYIAGITVSVLLCVTILVLGCDNKYVTPSLSGTSGSGYTKVDVSSSECFIGAFVNGTSNIAAYQALIGRELALVMFYSDFTSSFPLSDCTTISNNGSVPCITWEPWRGSIADANDPTYSIQKIINGDFDTYISAWATAAKSFRYEIFLRFAHEMNGNWYPWSGSNCGGSSSGPSNYISAWKHVRNIFDSVGATNVTWVWNVNAGSTPSDSWNSFENYYPGDAYVDWVAVDGYNWGTSVSGTSWQTFDTIFGSAYSTLIAAHPTKPIMIGEMACSEIGGSASGGKAGWITDAFVKIKSNYPNIKAYNWFNISKETDWTITSSPSSKLAMSTSMSDLYYIDHFDVK